MNRNIASVVVSAALLLAAGVAPGTQLNPASGVGVVSGGFEYTPGPNNFSGFDDLHITNQETFWSFNGTTIGGSHDDVVLTKVGGGTFSLQSFDFAGFPGGEMPFSVVGTYADTTTITQNFSPDGLLDGPGGVDDFQTFTMVGVWSNLVAVTWNHTGAGTVSGLFALDNIVVDGAAAVPLPSSVLMGLGLLGGLGVAMRLRRRNRAVIA